MRLSTHSNCRAKPFTRALTSLSLLLATACGGELPPEDTGDRSTLASSLQDSCSPDVTPPVVTCQPEEPYVECFSGYLYPSGDYWVKDNCEVMLTSVYPAYIGGQGTYVTTVSAVDTSSNSARCSTKWKVLDTLPPTLTLKGPAQVVIPFRSGHVEQGADGSDLCDGGDLRSRIQSTGRVDHAPGISSVTYSLADGAGHVSRATRLITELPEGSCSEQLTAPVLLLQGNAEQKVECGRSAWNDPGALAADQCGVVTVHSYNSGKDEYGPGPNGFVEGSYSVQYLAWNGQGTTSALRTVTVEDTTPPRLGLYGFAHMTHTCGSAWVDPGAYAQDLCYGNVNYSIQVTGSVNGWVEGSYTLSYVARDPGGRQSNVAIRTVDVVDCPW
ncbi:immunoglobulin-like domain-containing protein [Hyalangium versicolor]|uniref:immunoglobulin-like domain-containing protein n=1 Tax=Hyalangium versicolor TaxID=2861190 RepID=UPI001CCA18DA|nr:immunoglobulin-like domain-containing protein [Hyalangium versicolor]